MEAIEFALAEPGASPHVTIVRATARDVLDGRTRPEPSSTSAQARREDPPRRSHGCVEPRTSARRARSRPAELVFLRTPAPGMKGSSARAPRLSSGNTLREARSTASAAPRARRLLLRGRARHERPRRPRHGRGPARSSTSSAPRPRLFVRTGRTLRDAVLFAIINDRDSYAPTCSTAASMPRAPERRLRSGRRRGRQSRLSFIQAAATISQRARSLRGGPRAASAPSRDGDRAGLAGEPIP